MTPADAADTKAARTRSAIIDAALRLFRERGYDATTMRAIAAEAGVSVGNAYYYFESKEQLVQGFYDRAQVDHAAAARPVLDAEVDLAARIVGVGEAWLQLRGEAPEERRLANSRSLALTHNLGGYPGEMVSFVGIVGSELG